MTTATTTENTDRIGVSLVDGEAAVRHARQLMLRSEGYAVRSYSTCAALLADPSAREYPCIILDLEMEDIDGPALLRAMRASGWHGRALLLDGVHPNDAVRREAAQNGDIMLERTAGDQTLLTAIAVSIERG